MIFLLTAVSAVSALAFTVGNLRVQSLRNPSGIDVLEPQFSWQLQSEGRGVMQTTYQLVVTTDAKGQTIITSASGHHHSYYGDIRSAWQTTGQDALSYECTVPANTTATLRLPAADEQTAVYEGGVAAAKAEGVDYCGYTDGCHVFSLGSGSYHFTTSLKKNTRKLHPVHNKKVTNYTL